MPSYLRNLFKKPPTLLETQQISYISTSDFLLILFLNSYLQTSGLVFVMSNASIHVPNVPSSSPSPLLPLPWCSKHHNTLQHIYETHVRGASDFSLILLFDFFSQPRSISMYHIILKLGDPGSSFSIWLVKGEAIYSYN